MLCLLTALGSYGDVYPMIGLGLALRDRGHDVRLITNPYFERPVREAGLEPAFVMSAEDYEALTARKDLWSPTGGLHVVFRYGAIGVLEELYSLLQELYQPGETVIAAHGLDLASRIFAETHDTPVASVVYAPMAIWSNESPPRMPAGFAWPGAPRWLHRLQFAAAEQLVLKRIAVRDLEAFRAKQGLTRLRGSYWDWYYGVAPPLGLFPDWFVSPDGNLPSDWPAGTVATGFPLGDAAAGRGQQLAPEVEAFLDAGDPPIVFTPGSAMRHGERFFAAAIDACHRLDRRGVLLTKYQEQLPDELPETILAPGFTPLARLLERSAAFVHHGGIGSSARGLAAGVSQLIQPMAFDQHDDAWRLRRLGVAEELSRKRFRGPAVAAKLDQLLTTPSYREAAQSWSNRIDPAASLDQACQELENRWHDQHRQNDRQAQSVSDGTD